MSEKPVWLIDGDGSFQMTSEELATAFHDHTPVKIALLNNSVYGMVRQWQTLFYDRHYSATNLLDGENTPDIVDVPDFVKLAEAYGCVGMRAFTKDEAIECIKKANEINDRPVLIDFRVWKDAMVWPMVAAGDSNDNVTYMPGVKPCSAPARTSERVERKEGHFDHGKLSCIPAGSKRHTLSVLVENRPGVLARISGLFARRAFNIDSLSVSPTERPDISRVTVTAEVEEVPLEQIIKQLNKLLHVLKIVELDPNTTVERELVLIKVAADESVRSDVLEIVRLFRVRVVDVNPESLTIEPPAPRARLTRCSVCWSITASSSWFAPARSP